MDKFNPNFDKSIFHLMLAMACFFIFLSLAIDVPVNTLKNVKIPVIDADNDVVR